MSDDCSDESLINIKFLTSVELMEFMNSFDIVISETEDILWTHNEVIPSGVLLVEGLVNKGKSYRLLIENTQRSQDEILHRLSDLGLSSIQSGHIITPAKVLYHYLKDGDREKPIYSLANPWINEFLTKKKIGVIKPEPKLDVSFDNMEKRLRTYCKVRAVVVDYNPNIAWNNFALANQYLKKNPEAEVIGIHGDNFFEPCPSMRAVGARSILGVVAEGTSANPIMLCKPCPYIGSVIKDYFKVLMPSRVLFIGTSIEKDIVMANKCEFQTLLLKTPKLKRDSYLALPDSYKPKYFAESVTDLLCCLDINYDNTFLF